MEEIRLLVRRLFPLFVVIFAFIIILGIGLYIYKPSASSPNDGVSDAKPVEW